MLRNDKVSRAPTPAQKRRAKKQAAAVELLAANDLSDEKIGQIVGINRRTLTRWKLDPAFYQAVEQRYSEIYAQWMAETLARVAALDAQRAAKCGRSRRKCL